MSWKTARISILLVILIVVALDMVLEDDRLTSWDHPLRVVVYPVNGDDSTAAAEHLDALKVDPLKDIEKFLAREAERHSLPLTELAWVNLSDPITSRPPPIPHGGSVLAVMSWSLKMRYWMWRHDNYDGPNPELRVLALYYDPETSPAVPHSTGLTKGWIAITHIFAGEDKRNNVVIAHELLHTLGASDKYNLATDLPIYPDGYAEPDRQPLYPQRRAEIMGGRVPLSETEADMPASIGRTQIGLLTATEIGWLD